MQKKVSGDAFQSVWLSANQCSQICSPLHRNEKKEPITGHPTHYFTVQLGRARPHGKVAEHQKMIKASAVCELAHSVSS